MPHFRVVAASAVLRAFFSWSNEVKYKLGIIGAGKIGEALLAGAFAKGLFAPEEVILSVRTESHRQDLAQRYRVEATLDNCLVAANAGIVLLAVKPKAIADILTIIAGSLQPGTLVISTAAGVSLDVIESRVPAFVPVIRAMPNLAVAVGEGMTVLSCGKNVSPEQTDIAMSLFGSVGRAMKLDEQHMDAVTGLSGSGPAYIYIVIEALADGGVKMGLPRGRGNRDGRPNRAGSRENRPRNRRTPRQAERSGNHSGGSDYRWHHGIGRRRTARYPHKSCGQGHREVAAASA